MLKKYVEPTFTKALLTDNVMNAALEEADYMYVSTDTARDACFMYMSHKAVWDEELEQFRKEALPGEEDSEVALNAVAEVSAEVESALLWNNISEYRKTIDVSEVANALARCNLNANAEAVPFLISAFIVGGQDALSEYNDILTEEGMTIDDIKAIVKEIGMEET